MSYTFNPWRSIRVFVQQARQYRLRGDRKAAIHCQEAAAENRRRWLTHGTFHPQYIKKEDNR